MGSWNKTCGLTRLPIFAGEDVYVFFLRDANRNYVDRCYATALWSPNLINFQAKYNDYGSFEDVVEGTHTKILLETMRHEIKPMEQGENEYHDIPVDPETITLEGLQEAIHENRLFQKQRSYASSVLIDSTFLRKDVVDKIMTEYTYETYVGNGKGDRGWGNNYRLASFKEYFDALPEFITDFWDRIRHEGEDSMLRYRPFDVEAEYGSMKHLMCSYFRRENYRMFDTVYIDLCVLDLMDNASDKDQFIKEAHPIFESYLRGYLINSFMEMTRGIWAPGCHEGSQADCFHEYSFLINAMNEVVQARKREYEGDE